MNTVCLSGFTTRSVVIGDDHLLFTLIAKHRYEKKKGEDMTEYVPCCVLNPSTKLRDILLQEGLFLEFMGRISSSRQEEDGITRYFTKVIVEPESLNIIK